MNFKKMLFFVYFFVTYSDIFSSDNILNVQSEEKTINISCENRIKNNIAIWAGAYGSLYSICYLQNAITENKRDGYCEKILLGIGLCVAEYCIISMYMKENGNNPFGKRIAPEGAQIETDVEFKGRMYKNCRNFFKKTYSRFVH